MGNRIWMLFPVGPSESPRTTFLTFCYQNSIRFVWNELTLEKGISKRLGTAGQIQKKDNWYIAVLWSHRSCTIMDKVVQRWISIGEIYGTTELPHISTSLPKHSLSQIIRYLDILYTHQNLNTVKDSLSLFCCKSCSGNYLNSWMFKVRLGSGTGCLYYHPLPIFHSHKATIYLSWTAKSKEEF